MVVVGWKNESGSKEMGEVVSSKKLKKNNDRCPGGDKEKCGACCCWIPADLSRQRESGVATANGVRLQRVDFACLK
jgi:hypothetical protein